MNYVVSVAEHDIYTDPPNVITVAAATATEVLPNEQFKRTGEILQRLVQNNSANDLYYSENTSDANGNPKCDNTVTYHGVIKAYQQLDCSSHRQRVCVYAAAGAVVATTTRRRVQQGKG